MWSVRTAHSKAQLSQYPPVLPLDTFYCTVLLQQLVSQVRSSISELFALRARRISCEALGLAPMHYDILTFLCGMQLLGYALGTVATAQIEGKPDEVAQILFASLVTIYVIFYEMSFDLNRPFDGVYQIRRYGAAMHFLQVKHFVSNHPLVGGGLVDFGPVQDDDEEGAHGVGCDGDCDRRKSSVWYN